MNRMKNNKRRMAMLFFLGILIAGFLHAQEREDLTFVAVRDTVAISKNYGEEAVSATISAGDIITADYRVGYFQIFGGSPERHLTIDFYRQGRWFSVLARDFMPTNTEATFGDDIFIDYPVDRYSPNSPTGYVFIDIGDVDKMWVPAYYGDILASRNRDSLIQILPRLPSRTYELGGVEEILYWYEHPENNIKHGRAMFYNSVIGLGRATSFAVRNIAKENFGYKVDAVFSLNNSFDPIDIIFPESAFWENYSKGDELTLLLNLDGDYLDIYVDGSDTHIGTFMRVGREFIAQYQSLISTNTADLTNVQWPKRSGVFAAATHKTADRLRVREKADTASAIVTTLDTGTEVQLLETGATETIGGITAPWVKVLSANGFTGWAFSGYLETLNPETQNQESTNETGEAGLLGDLATPNRHPLNQGQNPETANANPANLERENVKTQNLENGFPVLPFAITGGVILVLGIAVVAVLAKRRKGKAAK